MVLGAALWETYGSNRNIGRLEGHKKAVTAVCWSPSAPRLAPRLYSASADGTIIVWDGATGAKLRRLRSHKDVVNCVACTRGAGAGAGGRGDLLVSGGNDGWVFLWDAEGERWPVERIRVGYPVTSVGFSDDGAQVYVCGVDNEVHAYDLARKLISFHLQGHGDTVVSSALSPDGCFLATYALDATVRVWDVRPFVPELPAGAGHAQEHDAAARSPRLVRTLTGAPSGYEGLLIRVAWSADGSKVACGGADRTSSVWDVASGKTLYKLPGHRGTCTAVAFHPAAPLLLSSSTDTTLFLGELEL